jgi:hypothetical protein
MLVAQWRWHCQVKGQRIGCRRNSCVRLPRRAPSQARRAALRGARGHPEATRADTIANPCCRSITWPDCRQSAGDRRLTCHGVRSGPDAVARVTNQHCSADDDRPKSDASDITPARVIPRRADQVTGSPSLVARTVVVTSEMVLAQHRSALSTDRPDAARQDLSRQVGPCGERSMLLLEERILVWRLARLLTKHSATDLRERPLRSQLAPASPRNH